MKEQYPSDYQWMDCNPSEQVPLTVIDSGVFDANGDCWWMRQDNEYREEMFDMASEVYQKDFPNLLRQIEFFAASKASVYSFDEAAETMKHYYQGAQLAIYALQASRFQQLSDISAVYLEKFEQLSSLDLKWWIHSMESYTVVNRKQLHSFIELDYDMSEYPEHLKSAMHLGARYSYILMAHHEACVNRESELAWAEHQPENTLYSSTDWI